MMGKPKQAVEQTKDKSLHYEHQPAKLSVPVLAPSLAQGLLHLRLPFMTNCIKKRLGENML